MKKTIFFILSIILFIACTGTRNAKDNPQPISNAIISGVAWFDQNGNEVSAHGACIVKEGGLYYLFGEYKSDTSNAFNGFSCYSSADLVNWKFERIAMPVQSEERIGERPKVMKCPSTGEFVMYMHWDDMGYRDPYVGYATSKTIDGEYEFQGPILFNGKPIRKWDMGTYQDSDGSGYLILHHGDIYKLADDYKSVESHVVTGIKNGESPAILKKDGTYYWLTSHSTSWERNDNYYQTAPSLAGPWEDKGLFAPEGMLTWNSQCTFVLPVYNDTDSMFMYMGDRWSFPIQKSSATYVWQPLIVKDGEISIPEFHQLWTIDFENAAWRDVENDMVKIDNSEISISGDWNADNVRLRSNEKGAVLTYKFSGSQVAIEGAADGISGYAKVNIKNNKGNNVLSTIVDFYAKAPETSLKFMSPALEVGEYTILIEVMGVHSKWSDKRFNDYGSKDDYVTVTGIYIL
ncbi:MAG: family 43 glycosylhydrolase [Rikenellaceae bacterium]|nr:family 43 glycosylhydrolase [Rikenellaceae bacterium]